MRRLIYTLLVAAATSLAFSACTEEDIAPKTETNGGGGVADPL